MVYVKDCRNPQTLNIISRVILVKAAILFDNPGRRFTVNNKNKPYEVNKAVRIQTAVCADFDTDEPDDGV